MSSPGSPFLCAQNPPIHSIHAGFSCNFAFEMHDCTNEAKLSSTPRRTMVSGIETFRRDLPESDRGFVVHTGDVVLPLTERDVALPMHLLVARVALQARMWFDGWVRVPFRVLLVWKEIEE
jgi:hypothetical protein